MRDRNILERNVELSSSAGEIALDSLRDGFSLGDELGGIELGDDGLEDLVSDGRQDSFIIIDAEVLDEIN